MSQSYFPDMATFVSGCPVFQPVLYLLTGLLLVNFSSCCIEFFQLGNSGRPAKAPPEVLSL